MLAVNNSKPRVSLTASLRSGPTSREVNVSHYDRVQIQVDLRFLYAAHRLCVRSCRSVGRSVRLLVGPSISPFVMHLYGISLS